MMIRYGMVQYEKKPALSEQEKIDELFRNMRSEREKEKERQRLEDLKAAQIRGAYASDTSSFVTYIKKMNHLITL